MTTSLVELVATSEGDVGSPLDTVVHRAVRDAFGKGGGHDARELAGRAVTELVSLDTLRPGSWFGVGLARGYGIGEGDAWPLPPTPELDYFHLLGQATAMVERHDPHALVAAALAAKPAVQRLVESPAARHLAAPLLSALVEAAPTWVADLLGRASLTFAGWERLIGAVERQASTLVRAADLAPAEQLLRAGEEVLQFWAGLAADLGAALAMERHQARLRLLRVTARRTGRDFHGAGRLLRTVSDDLLPAEARADVSCEWALTLAEVASVRTLALPGTPAERAGLENRLSRGEAHLGAALAAREDHALARLLQGLLCFCRGDETGFVRNIGVGEPGWPAPPGEVTAAARFRRAQAVLPLVEPGADDP